MTSSAFLLSSASAAAVSSVISRFSVGAGARARRRAGARTYKSTSDQPQNQDQAHRETTWSNICRTCVEASMFLLHSFANATPSTPAATRPDRVTFCASLPANIALRHTSNAIPPSHTRCKDITTHVRSRTWHTLPDWTYCARCRSRSNSRQSQPRRRVQSSSQLTACVAAGPAEPTSAACGAAAVAENK